jgi:hypothetical protein
MNVVKNVLFFGLLIAVLCGVYLSLKQQPETPLPPELAATATPPTVEIPGLNGPSGPSSLNNPNSNSLNAFSPPPSMTLSPSASGGTAPPFQAPPPSAGSSIAPPFPPPSASPPPPSNVPTPPVYPDRLPGPNYPKGVTDPIASGNTASSAGSASLAPPPVSNPDGPLGPPPDERAKISSIDVILQQVDLLVREKKLADALLILSPLRDHPDVPDSQARKITEILDQLAAKIVYSREDHLEARYYVQPGDTLDTIADHYRVPPLLLARINGIRNPQDLSPGTSLKVLRGPFIAKIRTGRGEMTMMLSGRYAGRFPVSISNDLQQANGLYTVRGKSAPGTLGASAKPQWIELDNASGKIGIEASADGRTAGNSRSTIWLSEQDMDDVYGILSVGSTVIIQR